LTGSCTFSRQRKDETILREAGFSNVNLFYAGFTLSRVGGIRLMSPTCINVGTGTHVSSTECLGVRPSSVEGPLSIGLSPSA
jgi:hypothetical protein